MGVQIEICCGDLAGVLAAKEGGAERIELCAALSEGGVTPSYGLIKAAVDSGIKMVNVLIRPRGGDFLYSNKEISLMEEDITMAIESGASGIVIGALTIDGDIDTELMKRFIRMSREINPDIEFTFHRAFDMVKDPFKSLEKIISLEFNTILTSGLAPNAVKGIPMLRSLNEKSKDRIKIMAGSGINPENAVEIIESTGIKAIHSSAREKLKSKMNFMRNNISMGSLGSDEYSISSTSPEIVKRLVNISKL